MNYRYPNSIDVDRLAKAVRAVPQDPPSSGVVKLFIAMGLIAAPIFAFFLIVASSL